MNELCRKTPVPKQAKAKIEVGDLNRNTEPFGKVDALVGRYGMKEVLRALACVSADRGMTGTFRKLDKAFSELFSQI